MDRFRHRIIARDGARFWRSWEKALKQEKKLLRQAGYQVQSELGYGGRGVVFALRGRDRGEELAAKVFVYKEECQPQLRALRLWAGFAPWAEPFSERTILLEKLLDKPGEEKKTLESGALLLGQMAEASPKDTAGAVSAKEHFRARLGRARERNQKTNLYSRHEQEAIEQLLEELPEENTIIHGDFSPSNVLFDGQPHLIDPRAFLQGPLALDAAKWALSHQRGRDVRAGLEFFAGRGFALSDLLGWAAVQAYDDSSAFAYFGLPDERIERYRAIALAA